MKFVIFFGEPIKKGACEVSLAWNHEIPVRGNHINLLIPITEELILSVAFDD